MDEQVPIGVLVVILEEVVCTFLERGRSASRPFGIFTEQPLCTHADAEGKQHEVASNQASFEGVDLPFDCGVCVGVVLVDQVECLTVFGFAVAVAVNPSGELIFEGFFLAVHVQRAKAF